MNAASVHRDLETFVHEAGHAMHSVYSDHLLSIFTAYPMEIAEVASMSMELMTMKFWGRFYTDANDLTRAQEKQIE